MLKRKRMSHGRYRMFLYQTETFVLHTNSEWSELALFHLVQIATGAPGESCTDEMDGDVI